jgi:hypothetical protein
MLDHEDSRLADHVMRPVPLIVAQRHQLRVVTGMVGAARVMETFHRTGLNV